MTHVYLDPDGNVTVVSSEPDPDIVPRECKLCGKEFIPNNDSQIICDLSCTEKE